MAARYDAVVVGGGHNGLVAAAYLARAGKRVLVLEKRDVVGGACVTEEFVEGYHFSACAFLFGLFRPQVLRDLELERFGYEAYSSDPIATGIFPDGSKLLFWKDLDRTLGGDQADLGARRRGDPRVRHEAAAVRVADGAVAAAPAAVGRAGGTHLPRGGGRESLRRVRQHLGRRPARPPLRVGAAARLLHLPRHGLDPCRAVLPRHVLPVRAPRMGRVRGRVRALRLRQGRHRRRHAGARRLRPPPRRRDPHRSRGRPRSA